MPKKHGFIFAILILIICYLIVVPTSSAEKSATWVGILREDGIIIPVGVYHSTKWETSWPEADIEGHFRSDKGGPLHQSLPLDRIPSKWLSGCKEAPRKWRLISTGLDQQGLTAEEAVEFGSHCSCAWGLKTSFHGKIRTPDGVEPKIKVGMVTSGIAKGLAPKIVDPNSNESKRLTQFLREKFDVAEQEAISKASPLYTGHPISKGERIHKPIKAETVFKMKTERMKQDIYFISMVRQYEWPKRQDTYDCYAESLYNVWVLGNNQQYRVVSAEIILTDCEGKEANRITPLGVLSIENREYVISVEYGYEWEHYAIRMLDRDAMKTVLFVSGGGC